MIAQSTIDRIIDAASIYDVVSDYVTLRRSGASYKGLCPFHDDTTPSFYVSPAKNLCKCFSCGKGGNPIHFIMEIEQLNFFEAIKFLGKRFGIEVEDKELTPEERKAESDRESMFAVNEWASGYFHSQMLDTDIGKAVGLAYFRGRGFRDDIIEEFRLGFCPDKMDAMSSEAIRKGYNADYLVRTGLAFRMDNGQMRDKYRGRVIFPWFGISGKVTGFGGRVLDARTKGVSQKYINSPASEIYDKSRELYGIFQAKKAIKKEDRVYMVEGYTDVISMHQCGVENVVANSGTALTDGQIRILLRFTNNITLLYDGDAAGIHAAMRGTNMLLAAGMNVNILLLPDGDDPDSFARKHNASEFKAYVEANQKDFITFKADLLMGEAGNDPQKKKNLIEDIVESIASIPEEIGRSVYIHQCSEMMKVAEGILVRDVARKRNEKRPSQADAGREPTAATDNTAAQDGTADAAKPVAQDEPAISDTRLIKIEKALIRLIVRYGGVRFNYITSDGDKANTTIVDFISQDLEADDLHLQHPLYRSMLSQAAEVVHNPANDAQPDSVTHHFLSNSDLDISRMAAEMMSDRYVLSKSSADDPQSEESRPEEFAVHLLLDYKFVIIEETIEQIKRQLADPAVLSDSARCAEILRKQMAYNEMKKCLAKRLGDRVVG
ncbi:MAG: DNA primase [Bacteroidaceae bacterium]|nr:DNA primase [Bacteroidaceae bacterium]